MACNHNCGDCGSSCGDKESLKKEFNPKSTVKNVIAVMSGKGGVGKTSICTALASEVARRGYKVGVMDADITGPSVPKAFGLSGGLSSNGDYVNPLATTLGIRVVSANLLLDDVTDPLLWRGAMIANMVNQFWTDVVWGDLDYMFIDMPPGTGDVPLTVLQSFRVDGIIIVTSPQGLVSMIVEKAVKMAKMMDTPILGLIENYSYLSCPDCNRKIEVFGTSNIDQVASKHKLEILGKLPIDSSISLAIDNGKIEYLEIEAIASVADKISRIV